jgi:hypothetical protein
MFTNFTAMLLERRIYTPSVFSKKPNTRIICNLILKSQLKKQQTAAL